MTALQRPSSPRPLLGHHSPSAWTKSEKLKRLLWLVVSGLLFRWSPPGWFAWRNFWLRLFGTRFNDTKEAPARVWPSVLIHFPWKLSLGAGCLVGPGCRIYNLGTVTIEAGANLSRNIHVCSGSHDFSRWDMPLLTAPIHLGANVWIATDSFIGPGVSVGELSVVGARSVVMRDLPAGMLCVGHPCKPIKPRPPIT